MPLLRRVVGALVWCAFGVLFLAWTSTFVGTWNSSFRRVFRLWALPAVAVALVLGAISLYPIRLRRREVRRSMRTVIATTLVATSMVVTVIVDARSKARLLGVPSQRDGRYFVENHGAVTEVTRGEWQQSGMLVIRAGLVFLLIVSWIILMIDVELEDRERAPIAIG